jgi:hypothetical protein
MSPTSIRLSTVGNGGRLTAKELAVSPYRQIDSRGGFF